MTQNSGKGDSPRNCFSKNFKKNYEAINWTPKIKKVVDNPHHTTHSLRVTNRGTQNYET